MATNVLLSVAATANESADFTVAVGSTLSVFLDYGTGVEQCPRTAEILIQKKSGSDYHTMFRLNAALPAAVIEGAGTYRAKRGVQDVAVGLDSET
jgi:hypothetical protein